MDTAVRKAPFHFGQESDVGCVRDVNEDNFARFDQDDRLRWLFVVADGMGGERGGRVASKEAVDAVRSAFHESPHLAPAALLAACVERANLACLTAQQNNPELATMGTTLDLLLVDASTAWWAHVGDSRIYEVTRRGITRLTTDHTRVQQMLDGGLITTEAAAEHPQRNVLSRVVGRTEEWTPDISEAPLSLRPGQTFVLCSDGLTDLVSDDEIAWIVQREDPERACSRLVNLAKKRGAPDNVTVQVVRIGSPRSTTALRWHRAISPLSPARRPRVRRVAAAAMWLVLAGSAVTAIAHYGPRLWNRWRPASQAASAPAALGSVPEATPTSQEQVPQNNRGDTPAAPPLPQDASTASKAGGTPEPVDKPKKSPARSNRTPTPKGEGGGR